MTTTLSPVTESEMNQFFNGIQEFKGRIATSIVAHSEQVQRIDDLTKLVHDLQSQVQALTKTINQLTEDRNRAEAERDRAVASEKTALTLAQDMEYELAQVKGHMKDMATTIGTLQETKFNLEVSNAELREQNERQTVTVREAVEDNQTLQDRISALVTDRNQQSEIRNKLTNQVSDLSNEVLRLSNLLLGAKAVLEGIDCPRREHAA